MWLIRHWLARGRRHGCTDAGRAVTRTATRLRPWQHRLLLGSAWALLATGGFWLALHYGRGADTLPHPLEATLMRLHGAASFAALFVLGGLAFAHVPAGWHAAHRPLRAPQRGTGLGLCSLAIGLVVTAWMLYYAAPEAIRPALGWTHATLGMAMGGVLAGHRRRRRLA
jgi:hypothetical protein